MMTSVKFVSFFSLFLSSSDSLTSLVKETVDNKHLLLLYFIPSFLYCIYNNLTFKNLSTFDPTTYYLLLQFRVVITGVLFQVSQGTVIKQKPIVFILTNYNIDSLDFAILPVKILIWGPFN